MYFERQALNGLAEDFVVANAPTFKVSDFRKVPVTNYVRMQEELTPVVSEVWTPTPEAASRMNAFDPNFSQGWQATFDSNTSKATNTGNANVTAALDESTGMPVAVKFKSGKRQGTVIEYERVGDEAIPKGKHEEYWNTSSTDSLKSLAKMAIIAASAGTAAVALAPAAGAGAATGAGAAGAGAGATGAGTAATVGGTLVKAAPVVKTIIGAAAPALVKAATDQQVQKQQADAERKAIEEQTARDVQAQREAEELARRIYLSPIEQPRMETLPGSSYLPGPPSQTTRNGVAPSAIPSGAKASSAVQSAMPAWLIPAAIGAAFLIAVPMLTRKRK